MPSVSSKFLTVWLTAERVTPMRSAAHRNFLWHVGHPGTAISAMN